MKQRTLAALPLAVLAWLGMASCAAAMGDCAHHAERNLDLDAGGVATLALAARAGELDIRGEPGLQQIVVRGTACASSADLLQSIQLLHRAEGDRRMVTVEIPKSEGGWFGDHYQRLDLEVRVPAQLALEIADSSGDTRIQGVGRTTVQDSSGELRIDDVTGDLTITDSSGDIHVRGVSGGLHVPADSSGDIDARNIGGSVVIEHDSSGEIELQQVRGDARIEVDSSGGIAFADIDGSAFVGTDSSGSIEATRIGGDFTVERDGSGGITHREIAGDVHLPAD